MLMRTDPFRELDRLANQLSGTVTPGMWSRPSPMPIDAYRSGDDHVIVFGLPGKPRKVSVAGGTSESRPVAGETVADVKRLDA